MPRGASLDDVRPKGNYRSMSSNSVTRRPPPSRRRSKNDPLLKKFHEMRHKGLSVSDTPPKRPPPVRSNTTRVAPLDERKLLRDPLKHFSEAFKYEQSNAQALQDARNEAKRMKEVPKDMEDLARELDLEEISEQKNLFVLARQTLTPLIILSKTPEMKSKQAKINEYIEQLRSVIAKYDTSEPITEKDKINVANAKSYLTIISGKSPHLGTGMMKPTRKHKKRKSKRL